MKTADENLAHSIKMSFGTAQNEPNAHQLESIKSDLLKITKFGRVPTPTEWLEIVSKHCPGTGHHKYAGIDSSDLITLLKLATKPVGG